MLRDLYTPKKFQTMKNFPVRSPVRIDEGPIKKCGVPPFLIQMVTNLSALSLKKTRAETKNQSG